MVINLLGVVSANHVNKEAEDWIISITGRRGEGHIRQYVGCRECLILPLPLFRRDQRDSCLSSLIFALLALVLVAELPKVFNPLGVVSMDQANKLA